MLPLPNAVDDGGTADIAGREATGSAPSGVLPETSVTGGTKLPTHLRHVWQADDNLRGELCRGSIGVLLGCIYLPGKGVQSTQR